MQLPDHPAPPPPTTRGPSRAVWTAAILTALLVAVGAAVFATRGDEQAAGSLPPAPSSPPATAATTTTIDPETEVAARLKEILRVREEAFAKRDASLFDQIYSDDCPVSRLVATRSRHYAKRTWFGTEDQFPSWFSQLTRSMSNSGR